MTGFVKTQHVPTRYGRTLIWLWGSWLVFSTVKALQHQLWPREDAPETSLTLIVMHAVVVSLTLLASGPPKLAYLLIGAYFVRLFTMLFERFATWDLPFLTSGEDGGDADGFFLAASMVADNLTLAGDTYGGAYTAILGYLFYFIGPDRLLGQYLNILLGLTTVILMAGVLRQLRISLRIMGTVVALAAFMPMLVVHSSILLRETMIQALIAAALYSFVKGLLESRFTWIVIAILWVLGASIFHAGVLGVLIGFAFASAFTYRLDGRFVFGVKRIAPVLLIAVTAGLVALEYPEVFLGKFQTLESPDDLLEQGPSGRGGSAYLQGLEVNDWLSFIAYSPLKAFYFIASPVPWDWRGVGDILAFGLDSVIYLTVVVIFVTRRISDPNMKYLARLFALVLLVTCLIFGVGVSNSGTAIRHRGKFIAVFLSLLAIVLDATRKKLDRARSRKSVGYHGA